MTDFEASYIQICSTSLNGDHKNIESNINSLRYLVSTLKGGPRNCYERFDKESRKYMILIPNMFIDEHVILIYKDLGYSVTEVYRMLRAKEKKKQYQKIRL